MAGVKVRLGFIGAGWWATTNHMPILKARSDTEFVGVASLGHEALSRVRDQFGFGMATENVDELLAQGLDGVVIASPHDLHAEHAIKAIKANCHVMVEKPYALSSQNAWAITNEASKRSRHVLVPYGWNYKSFLGEAKRLLARGLVGDIQYVLCHMASPTIGLFAGSGGNFAGWEPTVAKVQTSTWQDSKRGGGYAHGQITHSAALLFWLTELRTQQVQSCLMSNANAGVDLYDSASVVFEGGAIGTISGAATLPDNDPYQIDIRIFGSEGVLLVDVERERVELRRRDGANVSIQVAPGSGAYTCDEPPNEFVELIQGRGTNNSDGAVAAKTVELLDAMHVAHATGRPTKIWRAA
jgi:predicted dehydrogenase